MACPIPQGGHNKTRDKDVLPNTDRTQAAVSVYCRHPVTPRGLRMQRTAYSA